MKIVSTSAGYPYNPREGQDRPPPQRFTVPVAMAKHTDKKPSGQRPDLTPQIVGDPLRFLNTPAAMRVRAQVLDKLK